MFIAATMQFGIASAASAAKPQNQQLENMICSQIMVNNALGQAVNCATVQKQPQGNIRFIKVQIRKTSEDLGMVLSDNYFAICNGHLQSRAPHAVYYPTFDLYLVNRTHQGYGIVDIPGSETTLELVLDSAPPCP